MSILTIRKNSCTRLFELDALRGFAALFVVAFHFSIDSNAFSIFKFGLTGVDLFFMISGFVILLTLEKTGSAKEFILNRISRLYPTYWTCVTITSAVMLINGNVNGQSFPWRYIANLTMFQLWFKQKDIDFTYWTMIVEMEFYLLVVFLIFINQLRRIESVFLIILGMNMVYSLSGIEGRLSYLLVGFAAKFPIVYHVPMFISGVVFYKMKTDKQTIIRYLFLCLTIFCQLKLYPSGGFTRGYISSYAYCVALIAYHLLFILFINGKLGFIVNKISYFFGRVSYSLYLIHEFIGLSIIIPFCLRYTDWWGAALSALIISTALATIIHVFIEVPMMNYLRRRYKTTHIQNDQTLLL